MGQQQDWFAQDAPAAPSQPASGGGDWFAANAPAKAASSDDRSIWQKMKDNFNAATQGSKPGEYQTNPIKAAVEDVGAGGGDVIRAIAHPLDTIHAMTHTPDAAMAAVAHAFGDDTALQTLAATPAPNLARTLGQIGTGSLLGEGIGEAVPLIKGPVSQVPGKVAEALRSTLAGDINAPITGEGGQTPLTRYQAMQRVGVQPNAAAATNSPVLNAVRSFNEGSPFAAGIYDKAKGANLAALTDAVEQLQAAHSTVDPETAGAKIAAELRQPLSDLQDHADSILNSHSTLTPEQGGARLQALVNDRVDQLQAQKQALYKQVGDDWGNQPVSNPKTVVDTAKNISLDNLRADIQNPSLSSPKLNKVLAEARQLGSDGQVEALGPPTVNDLVRTRSGLLDLTRDPDIIKSSHANNIDQLMKAYDQAIVDSLPEEGQAAWREANSIHADIKNTFDNPSNPLYNAVRTSTPSTLTQGIGGTSPEALARLQATTKPEGVGIVRRGVLEKLLGKTEDGQYDLDNFGTKLQRMPLSSRMQLFGLDGNAALEKLASDYADAAPYKKAAFDTAAEQLVQGVGSKTGTGFADVADRISPESVGAIQRAAIDQVGRTDRHGAINFQTYGGRLNKFLDPASGYADALFQNSPESMTKLRDIGTTANAMDFRPNPSGTAHLNQKITEIGAIPSGVGLAAVGHPLPLVGAVGVAATQRLIGGLMHSPAFVEWLMTPEGKATMSGAPARGGSLRSAGVTGAALATRGSNGQNQP